MSLRETVILEDTVVKRRDPDQLRVEVEKTRRAWEIAQAGDLFLVPRVLKYNPPGDSAVFERMHGIRSVADPIAFQADCTALLEKVGRSLAVIHQRFRLPDEMKAPLPEELRLTGDTEVFLHGDFNTDNVAVATSDGRLVILDWMTTDVHGHAATYGTRYFDLAWFINGMFYLPTFRYLLARPEPPRARVFLKAYFDAAGLARLAKAPALWKIVMLKRCFWI